MANNERGIALSTPVGALKRPWYKVGSYLSAQDLQTEQHYRLQRLRRHARYLHGWGVICGLRVVPTKKLGQPWAVQVCPGYAIGPCGDEIEVSTPAMVDVHDYLWRRPPDSEGSAPVAYVGIRYAELQKRLLLVSPVGCGCDEEVYEPSRVRDSFQVDILWTLPETSNTEEFDLCDQRSAPCPEVPDSVYVILAGVTLPASEGDPITMNHIDNFVRRQISCTTMLQEQLSACCCEEGTQEAEETADLVIAKSVINTQIADLSEITYRIEVTNNGPMAAQNIIITDSLTIAAGDGRIVAVRDFTTSHGNWTSTELSESPTAAAQFNTQIASLLPQEMATLEFVARIRIGQGFTIVNTAEVSSDTPDSDPTNNTATVTRSFP